MAKRSIVVEFIFDEIEDDGSTYLELDKIVRDEERTTASDDQCVCLTEDWAQSDFYNVEVVMDLLDVLEGVTVFKDEIKIY